MCSVQRRQATIKFVHNRRIWKTPFTRPSSGNHPTLNYSHPYLRGQSTSGWLRSWTHKYWQLHVEILLPWKYSFKIAPFYFKTPSMFSYTYTNIYRHFFKCKPSSKDFKKWVALCASKHYTESDFAQFNTVSSTVYCTV